MKPEVRALYEEAREFAKLAEPKVQEALAELQRLGAVETSMVAGITGPDHLQEARDLAAFWRAEAVFGDLSLLEPEDKFPWETKEDIDE